MNEALCDILMITYNRPRYTRMSLARLLETADEMTRVWVWHNGDDVETLAVVRSFENHPHFHRLHHSAENLKLREPTNWFWANADGGLLGKVDDDCLMPDGWISTLRRAHADVAPFGVIGCWLFQPEDIVPEVAQRKIRAFEGGHQLMLNCWLGGSGYLMKRKCYEENGPLRPDEGYTSYCLRLARRGWTHGWYYPLLYMDHMDDPRSPNTVFKSEADYQANRGLTAANRGIPDLKTFRERQAQAALELQTASPNIRHYAAWRVSLRRLRGKIGRAFKRKAGI